MPQRRFTEVFLTHLADLTAAHELVPAFAPQDVALTAWAFAAADVPHPLLAALARHTLHGLLPRGPFPRPELVAASAAFGVMLPRAHLALAAPMRDALGARLAAPEVLRALAPEEVLCAAAGAAALGAAHNRSVARALAAALAAAGVPAGLPAVARTLDTLAALRGLVRGRGRRAVGPRHRGPGARGGRARRGARRCAAGVRDVPVGARRPSRRPRGRAAPRPRAAAGGAGGAGGRPRRVGARGCGLPRRRGGRAAAAAGAGGGGLRGGPGADGLGGPAAVPAARGAPPAGAADRRAAAGRGGPPPAPRGRRAARGAGGGGRRGARRGGPRAGDGAGPRCRAAAGPPARRCGL